MPAAVEESKEQLSVAADSASPLFHRRQLAPKLSSSPPLAARTPPLLPSSEAQLQETSAAEDELDALTAAEIAAIPIPTAPTLPFALTDPLSPPHSPTHASSPSASSTLATLLQPFTSAYDEQRRTLVACQQSIARLTQLAHSELKAATRAAEKRALSQLNYTECSGQERKIRERKERGEREKAKMEAELADSKVKVESIKAQLAALGASIEKQTVEYCAGKEAERDEKERQLERSKAEEDERREELRVIRAKNVHFFMQLSGTMEALSREETEHRATEAEHSKMQQLIAYWNDKRSEVNERKTRLAAGIDDAARVKADKDELCGKMRREIAEIKSSIVHQQQLLVRIVEEAAVVEEEERKEREWIGLVKDENEYNANETHTLERLVDMDRVKLREDRRNKRRLLKKRALLSAQLAQLTGEMEQVEGDKAEAERAYERAAADETAVSGRWKAMTKQIEFHSSEQRILSKSVEAKESSERKKLHLYKLRQSQLHHYHTELAAVAHSIDELSRQGDEVDRELTELAGAVQHYDALGVKYTNMNCDIAALLGDSNAELSTLEHKLSDQTALLDSIAADRDQCRRVIVEKSTLLKLNRQALEIKRREVEDDKKRIYFIEKEMAQLQASHAHWQSEHNKTQAEDERLLSKRARIDADIAKLTANLNEVTALCTACTREEVAERKQLAAVVGEERVLNVQLVARETESTRVRQELKLLYSKVKQCERSVRSTHADKQLRLGQLSVLKRAFDEAMHDLSAVKSLRHDSAQLDAQLQAETRKRLALEDESSKRINIHRWRNLRDGRNDKYGLLTRKRECNNKLIALVRDIDERGSELKAERRMYDELEAMYNKMSNSRWVDEERLSVVDECVERKEKEKMIANQLHASIDRKKQLQYEVEQLNHRKQLLLLQYFARRSKQDQQARRASSKAAALGGGGGGAESEEEEEEDDVLKRSSFAAGEVYDADGNRVYEDDADDADGSSVGGSSERGDGGLVDTLVATQVRSARSADREEQKEQLS